MGEMPCIASLLQGVTMGKVEPGKRFEAKLKSSMDDAGAFSMRIPDKVYWSGSRIMSEETPADFNAYAVIGGDIHCYLIEAKACSKNRIPFDRLKQHQHDALLRFDSMHENAHGIVAVNFYDPVSLATMDVCFMVPIAVWDEYAGGMMKSLGHEDCSKDERIALCPKVKGAVYDLKGVFGNGGSVGYRGAGSGGGGAAGD